jgi:hypothetical protein
MNTRTGSTTVASILGIAGLLAAGFGTFAAYKSFVGGCGACCGGRDVVATAPAADVKADSCCALGGGKAIATSDTEEAESCCKSKAASDCCKTTGEGCEGKANTCHGGEKPAADNPA